MWRLVEKRGVGVGKEEEDKMEQDSVWRKMKCKGAVKRLCVEM